MWQARGRRNENRILEGGGVGRGFEEEENSSFAGLNGRDATMSATSIVKK